MPKRGTLRAERTEGSKHQFREFDVTVSDHIDPNRVYLNQYFDLTTYDGKEMLPMPPGACEKELIHSVYEREYSEGLDLQNAMYTKQGHGERCKTLEQLEVGKKTRPMEYIFQCGDMNNHVSGDELEVAFERYMARVYSMCKAEGIKCHFICAALHMDEKTPHIHYKVTFGANMERGGQLPRQEECFRQSSLELPDQHAPEGRYNNRLMSFTEKCRAIEIEVLRELGHEIEDKPRPNMRHLKTRDFYTQNAIQKEQAIREQVARINAQIRAERSEIAEERSRLENEYKTQTLKLDCREQEISKREALVKRIQDNSTIDLAGKPYNLLEILQGLEHYDSAEVGQYIDQMTNFFKDVASRGKEDLGSKDDWGDWDDRL